MQNVIPGPWTFRERARALGQHVEHLLQQLKTDPATRQLYDYYVEKRK